MAMPRRRDALTLVVGLVPLLFAAVAEGRDPAKVAGGPLDATSFGNRKEPITVTSDMLEYDYKANVVVYRGEVVATQGDVRVRSDTMTVTFVSSRDGAPEAAAPDPGDRGQQRLQEVVAVGKVRIDSGTRWATGGRAVFEQGKRTLVLTEDPVLHDGPNEVAGERVIVFLDENRSVVEGGRKRVKAVVFPKDGDGLAAAHADGAAPDAAPKQAASTASGSATP